VLLSAAYFLLQVAAPAAAITGTVRAGAEGRPLAGVRVEEAGATAATSDSSGRYVVPGLGAGSHRLRFMLAGYAPQELGVLLADSSAQVRVDVELVALPVHLPTVQVVARAGAGDLPALDDREAEIGRLSLADGWLDGRLAGQGDAQRALADLPGVQGRRESTAGLHVRGGASSENLVLLDGIPLFSAVHYSGAASAVDPDAIAGAELHTGVSPARFGDHLAGVVELESREPGPGALRAPGSVGPGEIRQTVAGYLPGIQTGLVLGGRTTYRDALMGEGSGGRSNGYGDLLGVATTRLGRGRLRLISFSASNRLDFPSVSDAGAPGSAEFEERALAADREESPAGRNAIAWSSHSQGVSWTSTGSRGNRVDAAAWWAGSSAQVDWLGTGGAERLRSELSEVGASVRAAWPGADGGSSVGASLVRPATRYTVTRAAVGSDPPAPGLALEAGPAVGSVFAERLWRPSPRLLLSAGLRASTDFSGWTGLEPRLTAVVTPDGRTRLGLGVGRSHQVVQSLLNDESALGTLLGFDAPVAGGTGRLPIARADQLEAVAGRRLGSGLDLSVTGYLRRTTGIALGSASTPGLFPADSVAVGMGYASGVIGAFDLERGRLSGRAVVTVARDIRTAGTARYDASYGQGTSLALDLGYRFLQDSRFLLRFRGGARQPASIVAPGFEWQPYQPLIGSGELAGTPENLPGALNAARLPDYARLDLGLRRTWHLPGLGPSTALTTVLSVDNVLGRRNALGFVARPDGSMRLLPGARRGVTFEVGWSF
jgi:hypothetical protein